MAERYGTAFLFSSVELTPGTEPLEKWSFQFFEKDTLREQLDYFYSKCGFENHYKNHKIKQVRLTVKVLDRSPGALKASQGSGRRISIDTEEQWTMVKDKLRLGCAEVILYIQDMDTKVPHVSEVSRKAEEPGKMKKRSDSY